MEVRTSPSASEQSPEERGRARWSWIGAALAPLVVGPAWLHLLPRLWPGFSGGTFAGAILLTTLATCTVTDLRRRKIPNWATYTAFLWALALNIHGTMTGSLFDWGAAASGSSGAIGILRSFEGTALCFVITFLVFSFSGGGAGDVKLATVIGAFLGGRHGLMALAWSYVFAGVAILVWIVVHLGPIRLTRFVAQKTGSLLFPTHVVAPVTPELSFLKRTIPLAPSFACGTLCYLMQLSTW